jgi:hypothetical protein
LARPLLAAEYSIEAIGRKWSEALGADMARVAEPPIAPALAQLA